MSWLVGAVITVVIFFLLWMIIDNTHPLVFFRPYRKWRGGGWGKCSSCFPWVPYCWVRVGPECVERVDEDYR